MISATPATHERFAYLTFSKAFPIWLDSRVSIMDSTRFDYTRNFRQMKKFFGEQTLSEITIDDINKYRKLRSARAGARVLNKEINMLQQMMKKAGCWDAVGKWYERLPQDETDAGMALEPAEETYLFRVASSKPKWRVAYLASLLMRNTCICFGELRLVTLADIDAKDFASIRVRHGKNKFRKRTLPCNPDARFALEALYRLARKKGSDLPEHYLLPARGPKPDEPMPRAPYRAWWSLRKKAAQSFPRLAHVKFYDMRRTIITNLLEHPDVNYNTIEALAGHRVGSEVKRVYDYVRTENLQRATDVVMSGCPKKELRRGEAARASDVESLVTSPSEMYVRIEKNGSVVTLGPFQTREEASAAYQTALLTVLSGPPNA